MHRSRRDPKQTQKRAPKRASEVRSAPPVRVLVLEDNRDLAGLLRAFYERNYSTLGLPAAVDVLPGDLGADAFQNAVDRQLAPGAFDLVHLDIVLNAGPMSGLDILKLLGERNSAYSLVVLTGAPWDPQYDGLIKVPGLDVRHSPEDARIIGGIDPGAFKPLQKPRGASPDQLVELLNEKVTGDWLASAIAFRPPYRLDFKRRRPSSSVKSVYELEDAARNLRDALVADDQERARQALEELKEAVRERDERSVDRALESCPVAVVTSSDGHAVEIDDPRFTPFLLHLAWVRQARRSLPYSDVIGYMGTATARSVKSAEVKRASAWVKGDFARFLVSRRLRSDSVVETVRKSGYRLSPRTTMTSKATREVTKLFADWCGGRESVGRKGDVGSWAVDPSGQQPPAKPTRRSSASWDDQDD